MHNQPGISPESYTCHHWPLTFTQQLSSRLAKKLLSKDAQRRIKEAGLNLLATVAVAALLLSGICLFLVQLAEHGW